MSKYIPTQHDIDVVKAIASNNLGYATTLEHIIDLRFHGYCMVDGDGEIYLTEEGWVLAKANGWRSSATKEPES